MIQEALFYGFSLERHVPDNHLLRKIDRFVDLNELRAHLGPYYSETGRPSIAPELMVRMLIVGYCFGIRSERRLCDEVHLNLAYRWFCRLGLDGDAPDHSTFSKNCHGRFRESNLLRKLFETVVARCIKEKIVSGEAFGVDASMIVADACRRRGVVEVEDLDPTSSSTARGVSLRNGRRRLRGGDAERANVALADRSCGPLHHRVRHARVLHLFRQLSRRPEECHHHGRRGGDGRPPGGSRSR